MPKCLVIDDVEVTRYSTDTFLTKMGFEVSAANDPKAAIASLKKDSFNVILLDWHLGKESGIDLLREIREDLNIKIPVVVISGVKDQKHAPEAINAGANAFLEKPTTYEGLKKCLKNLGFKTK